MPLGTTVPAAGGVSGQLGRVGGEYAFDDRPEEFSALLKVQCLESAPKSVDKTETGSFQLTNCSPCQPRALHGPPSNERKREREGSYGQRGSDLVVMDIVCDILHDLVHRRRGVIGGRSRGGMGTHCRRETSDTNEGAARSTPWAGQRGGGRWRSCVDGVD